MRYFFTISKYNNQYLSTYFKVDNNNIVENKSTLSKDVDQTICYDGTDYSAIVDDTLVEIINKPQDSGFKNVQLDKFNSISILAADHAKIQKDYKELENCAVFSPFHILIDQVKLENKANTLNILIYNHKIYSIIVDTNFKIVFHSIDDLTPYQEIESSNFYTDEAQKQQLIQEILQIEIQKNIEDIIQKFYNQESTFFIESIDIFDPVMILKVEHTNEISKNISLNIDHKNIDINEILFRLVQKELNYKNLSYTDIQLAQKPNNNKYILIGTVVTLLLAVGYYIFTTQTNSQDIKQELEPKKIEKASTPITKTIKTDTKVNLPNHQILNRKITENLDAIFNSITYDGFIEKLTLDQNNTKLQLQLLHNDSFIKNIKPNLLKVYNDIKVTDTKKIDHLFNSKVICSNLIANTHETKIVQKEYLQTKIYTQQEIQNLIKSSLQNTKVLPLENKGVTYSFKVIKNIITPKDIYRVVSKLDSFNRAINISYPLIITKKKEKLEVEFILQYHQKKTDPK